MDFFELASERYSCRNISDREVPSQLIEKIIDTAILAPTAVNRQCFRLWVMESRDAKDKIKSVTRHSFGADNFIVVGAAKAGAWVRKYDEHDFTEVDASIVATHIMMEIEDLGLSTTWVGHFDAPRLAELFPEMQDYHLIAIFPFGYAADDAEPGERHSVRKSKEELVTRL